MIEFQTPFTPTDEFSSDEESQDSTHHDNHDLYATNEFIGDILEEHKPTNTTRLYFQNLHGIKWDKDGGDWPEVCDAMSAVQTCRALQNSTMT